MFRGQFPYTIDAKGRVSVPSKFRDVLKDKYDERLIITNFDGCLIAYPFSEWQILEKKAANLSMLKKEAAQFLRFFYSGAAECWVDKLGRILIPQVLRDYAKLEKDIMLVGVAKKIEIWSKARWDTAYKKSQENFDDVRDVLASMGL
ncbi:MAG: division/cell wall cluster transcriptional repressor MraZ [Deltaproteobacteria bacterium]|nr:division/cell wall cluster transcriptional repressor MraZ [Deltaproteobacteria bacterium]